MKKERLSIRFLEKSLFVCLSFAVPVFLICGIASFSHPTNALAQSSQPGHTYHVTGQGLPASLASPTSVEQIALTKSVTVSTLVLANQDSASHTVTVQDCQVTPFILYNGYTIPAGTTWIANLGDTRFQGCFKWTASDTKVMGTVVGTY